jgi:hypothetical protein
VKTFEPLTAPNGANYCRKSICNFKYQQIFEMGTRRQIRFLGEGFDRRFGRRRKDLDHTVKFLIRQDFTTHSEDCRVAQCSHNGQASMFLHVAKSCSNKSEPEKKQLKQTHRTTSRFAATLELESRLRHILHAIHLFKSLRHRRGKPTFLP